MVSDRQTILRRATRLEVRAPISYRIPGSREPWRAGTTLNVSRSGVLFFPYAYQNLPTHNVEFVVHLSAARIKAAGAPLLLQDLYCLGHLVRGTVLPRVGYVAAAVIDTERFELSRRATEAWPDLYR